MQDRVYEEVEKDEGYEVVERQVGNLLYIKNRPFPWRGIATPDDMATINKLKQAIKDKDLITFFRTKVQLPKEPQTFTKAIHKLTRSKRIAAIVEYDAAYRFRLQDLFRETNKESLPYEIKNLIQINKMRDQPEIHAKIQPVLKLLTYLPKFIIKWRLNKINYQDLLPDELDRYWMSQRTDYKHGA